MTGSGCVIDSNPLTRAKKVTAASSRWISSRQRLTVGQGHRPPYSIASSARGRHRSNDSSIIIARAVLESAIRDQADLLAILELRTAEPVLVSKSQNLCSRRSALSAARGRIYKLLNKIALQFRQISGL